MTNTLIEKLEQYEEPNCDHYELAGMEKAIEIVKDHTCEWEFSGYQVEQWEMCQIPCAQGDDLAAFLWNKDMKYCPSCQGRIVIKGDDNE